MPEYRLYCINAHGSFTKAHEFNAANDEEALKLARDLKLSVICELWQRERMVAKLDPMRQTVALA